jgi:hypothetical protein
MSREVTRAHAVVRAFARHVPPAPPRAHVSVPATLPLLPSVPSRHRELHSFAVALDYRDLCHLVLEDGNAHAALLAVVKYLQRYDPSVRPSHVLFSGRPKELNGTLAFVDATVSTPGWEELHQIERLAQEYCRFEVGVGGGVGWGWDCLALKRLLSEPWAIYAVGLVLSERAHRWLVDPAHTPTFCSDGHEQHAPLCVSCAATTGRVPECAGGKKRSDGRALRD